MYSTLLITIELEKLKQGIDTSLLPNLSKNLLSENLQMQMLND